MPWLLAGLLIGIQLAVTGWIAEMLFRDACAPALRRPDGWVASLLRLPIRLASGGVGFTLGAAAANGLRLVVRPFSPTRTFVGGAILNVLLQWILGLGKEKAPDGEPPTGAGSIPPVV